MSLTLSCKLAEVFAMICAVFVTKSRPRFRCTLALRYVTLHLLTYSFMYVFIHLFI